MSAEALIPQLQELSAEVVDSNQAFWQARFPAPPDADYSFSVYVYPGGETCISACRQGANDDEYFWHLVFEEADFSDLGELEGKFMADLVKLLNNPTRITQKKGALFDNFYCEYHVDGEWQSIGGNRCFRFSNFHPPKIIGKSKEYFSPATRGDVSDTT